jgi:hypothetical protein
VLLLLLLLLLPADVDLSLIISFQRMRDVLKVGLLQQWHKLRQTAADSQTAAQAKEQQLCIEQAYSIQQENMQSWKLTAHQTQLFACWCYCWQQQ